MHLIAACILRGNKHERGCCETAAGGQEKQEEGAQRGEPGFRFACYMVTAHGYRTADYCTHAHTTTSTADISRRGSSSFSLAKWKQM